MQSQPEESHMTRPSLSCEEIECIGVTLNGLTARHRFDIQHWLPHQNVDQAAPAFWTVVQYSGP